MYKLGAKDPVHDKRDLLFADYFDGTKKKPPTPPRTFGHENLVPKWGMLANDSVGCCVFSGGAHETMLFDAESKRDVAFDDDDVLADYSAVTGYVRGEPSTDQGTDVREALKYRRTTGLLDATGRRHRIGAFVALEPGNVEQLEQAMYLFGAAAIALNLPQSAMDQFESGKSWSNVAGSSIVGGHYVPGVAVRSAAGILGRIGLSRMIEIITWGQVQPMTMAFYERYNAQTFAVLSEEIIGADGKSLDGFDLGSLQLDLAELDTAPEVAA